MKIGKYDVQKTLGRGAAATVYLAHDQFRGKDIALKVVDESVFKHPAFQEVYRPQLQVEASLAGKLDHPHIVSIYDAVLTDTYGHIVMEYLPGGNLATYLKPGSLLPFDSAIEVVFKCCGALDYAFKHGIVHRDIKPANIMVGDGTDVKIGDFGAAYLHQNEGTVTMGLTGTPSYMSPEQVLEQPLTQYSDMFCLGIVAYELITGQRPFVAPSLPALFQKIVEEDPVAPSRVRASIPPEVDDIVLKALRKSPEKRHASWADFALDLATLGRLRSSQQSVADSEKFEALKRVKMLANLNDPDLWALAKAGEWSRVDAKRILIEEDAQNDRLFFLAKGEVKVTKRGRLLNIIHAGEFFGEMSFISAGALARQATVESLTELVIAEFDRGMMEQLPERTQTRFLWTVVNNVVERLAFADQRLAQGA